MTLGKLLDYSQARPNLANVKAAGYSAVYRYVCSDSSEAGLPGKRLTPTERDQILHAGLDIGLHGEDDSTAAKGGYARGKAQGQQWADYASSKLNAPKGMVIVAAVDFDTMVLGTRYPQIVDDYLRGVEDGYQGEYTLGVYGDHGVLAGAHNAGRGSVYVMTDAWDVDTPPAFCHLHQRVGNFGQPADTDHNDILISPHGTWLQTLGDPMPTAADIAKAVLTTDGIIPSPDWAPLHSANPFWTLGRYVQELLDQSHANAQQIAALKAELDALKQQQPTLAGTLHLDGDVTVTPK